jgi:hypothetical protein
VQLQRIPDGILRDTPEVTHYAHPRRLDKTWCGAEREPDPYFWNHEETITCVVCSDLYKTLGAAGWHRESA